MPCSFLAFPVCVSGLLEFSIKSRICIKWAAVCCSTEKFQSNNYSIISAEITCLKGNPHWIFSDLVLIVILITSHTFQSLSYLLQGNLFLWSLILLIAPLTGCQTTNTSRWKLNGSSLTAGNFLFWEFPPKYPTWPVDNQLHSLYASPSFRLVILWKKLWWSFLQFQILFIPLLQTTANSNSRWWKLLLN